MGKLSLDAVIQRDVPESTRNSAFARSETALQLSWVLGGAIGLLPMAGRLGFSVAAIAIAGALVSEFVALGRVRRRRRVGPAHPAAPPSAELPAS
jgi:hypothetical protein